MRTDGEGCTEVVVVARGESTESTEWEPWDGQAEGMLANSFGLVESVETFETFPKQHLLLLPCVLASAPLGIPMMQVDKERRMIGVPTNAPPQESFAKRLGAGTESYFGR